MFVARSFIIFVVEPEKLHELKRKSKLLFCDTCHIFAYFSLTLNGRTNSECPYNMGLEIMLRNLSAQKGSVGA